MNAYYVAGIPYTSELYHHGIKGQKWGIRRFQNPDGTYTQAGLKRYRTFDAKVDLGYKPLQLQNKVQKDYTKRYKSDVKGYMKNTKKSTKAKSDKRKDQYSREAKAYLSRSEKTKAMNVYYNSLFASDRKSVNKEYKNVLSKGKTAAMDFLDKEMLRRKVMSDRQKDIWDRE